MDLNSLLIFAKVIEAKSFSEAARRLKMPLSTVSRRIAELEDELGVRLLERSTRNLRLTDVGSEVLEQALRTSELNETVESIVSNKLSNVSGLLRLSSPPSISDTLMTPLVSAFQALYPNIRVQVLVTDRFVDHLVEGIDIAVRVGALEDSSLVVRRILSFREQLVASPAYLAQCSMPNRPQDLLSHRLLAFWYGKHQSTWTFAHINGDERETISFLPHLAMNDFAGLAAALLAGGGIGEFPPIVQPELMKDKRLVEILPEWRFRTLDVSLLHLSNRHVPRAIRVFKEFAAQMAPVLFPDLPV